MSVVTSGFGCSDKSLVSWRTWAGKNNLWKPSVKTALSLSLGTLTWNVLNGNSPATPGPDRAIPGGTKLPLLEAKCREQRRVSAFGSSLECLWQRGVEMTYLCSTCCVCLWKTLGRWLQKAGVPLARVWCAAQKCWNPNSHRSSPSQELLGWAGGDAREQLSQEWVRNAVWEISVRVRTWGKRGHSSSGASLGKEELEGNWGAVGLQDQISKSRRKESFSICAFSAIRPAKGKCFCDTRSALAEKDTNKNISTGSACF